MKATVGVGERCSPKEAAADTNKDALGVEDKAAVAQRRNDGGTANKATKEALD